MKRKNEPIHYTTASGDLVARAHSGDAGYDLPTIRTVTIPGEGYAKVRTGFCFACPPGTWLMLTGRSSSMLLRGLQVQMGVIDSGYRGEIYAFVHNTNSSPVTVMAGERICQVIPLAVSESVMRKQNGKKTLLPRGDRGEEGTGSTGR